MLNCYINEQTRVLDTETRVLQNSSLCHINRVIELELGFCTLLKFKADHKCACASSPVLQDFRNFVFVQKERSSHLRNWLSFNKRRWPLPQVRQGKMEGAFLRQDFPLVHAELCKGGVMAESLTRSRLIGRARSMAEKWAAQSKQYFMSGLRRQTRYTRTWSLLTV